MMSTRGSPFAEARYRIGAWVWELPAIPIEWWINLSPLHELWVPSTFCRETFAAVTERPVVRIPYVVPVPEGIPNEDPSALLRSLGIPAGAFVFLYAFDASSYLARKNPQALVQAFQEEFGAERDVYLLLKLLHPPSAETVASIGSGARIVVDTRLYPREVMTSLLKSVHCYVSPHRAEGFGLTVAEAMAVGKPVIATNYSGTTDLVSDTTGYPVDFALVEIEEDIGPYLRGNVWAEPSIPSLRTRMREVYAQYELAVEKGARGQALVQTTLSQEAVGAMVVQRLEEIHHRHGL
jgi:glycosyltransferase involved in cell wall biosynthesis